MTKEKSLIKTLKATPAKDYAGFIANLKEKIKSSQFKAALSVNREMIQLYWELGKDIVHKQEKDGWGSKVIERVAHDLQKEFPGIEGFSRTNIGRMRAFYLAYSISPQAVGKLDELPIFKLPWGQNIVLLESLKNMDERLWYANSAISQGWSRYDLMDSIKAKLYKRQGKAITNFHSSLPPLQSHLAHETLKDPYHFDFLEFTGEHIERDLEAGLITHVENFIREMGQGFSFVGRQVPIKVSDKEFYIDLLFYHLKLRCFVVLELKATDFKPEHAGKMNFYLTAVDELMKHATDNPTIGILICKKKDNFIVEYALRDIHKPVGVAEYETKIVSSLPSKLKGHLPTIEDIEAELGAPVMKKKRISKKRQQT